jgi:hypothetical protein
VAYDIGDTEATDARAVIVVRYQRYALMWAALGLTKDQEIATKAGYSTRSIIRARAGEPMGSVFIANTLHTLGRYAKKLGQYGLTPSFDDLFAVVDAPAGTEEAA